MQKRLVLIAALAAALLRDQPCAVAQAEPPAVQEEMRRHHERGTTSYNLGQFEDAISEYRKAYELKAEPVFLFNIAQAYRQLGMADKAAFFYKRYLSTAPDAQNRKQVEERIAELDQVIAAQARAKNAPPQEAAPSAAAPPAPLLTTPRNEPSALLVAASPPAPAAGRAPLWHRWWFWAVVGSVVVGGVTASIVASSGGQNPQPPRTDLGNARVMF